MRTLLVMALLLAGCSGPERIVSTAWWVCSEDNDRSCSDCTLSKEEARELALAHVAQHSKTDDELYYYGACEVAEDFHGHLQRMRPLNANYPEGK